MHCTIRLSIMCLLVHFLHRRSNVCNEVRISWNRTRVRCLWKKKTRLNKYTPKLQRNMGEQTRSSFYSPKTDPAPESSTSYTHFLFTAEGPAWQKSKTIVFGLHDSFSLLNTRLSPLRSSKIRINTSSWIPCYSKTKARVAWGDVSAVFCPSGIPLLMCTSWAPRTWICIAFCLSHKKTQENLIYTLEWHILANLEPRKHYSKMLREDFASTSNPRGLFVKKGYHIIPSFKIFSLHKAF